MLMASSPPEPVTKTVNVLFTPATKTFTYTGDIDPATEEIKVSGVGTFNIHFVLEGATWASPGIKWVTATKEPATSDPLCMNITPVDPKRLIIEDCCEPTSAGTYAFLVCVNYNGTVVCSDPRIKNEPGDP